MGILDVHPQKHMCFTDGCKEEGIWIPHLRIEPPDGVSTNALIVTLSMILCDKCRGKATLEAYVSEKDWELMTILFSFGPRDNPSEQAEPQLKNASLIFHTMDEVSAYVERGAETIN